VSGGDGSGRLPARPHAALRARVLAVAAQLESADRGELARDLRHALETWWDAEQGWAGEVARQLGVHHDINNALVGVRGNVQLLLMGPAIQAPGVKDRLEVVLRESDRIREAAVRLNVVRTALSALVRDDDTAFPSRAA
jgi:nitrogen-specific signal transduction histidine kinase